MKVLWFSLSPCGSLRKNNTKRVIQGWMISLEDEVKKHTDIQLCVAYPSETEEDVFEYDGVTYYPIYNKRITLSKWDKITNKKIDYDKHYNRLIPVMKEIIERVSPDIIHMHGTEEFMGLISPFVQHIPVVYSIQGLLTSIEKKFFSGLTHEEITKNEQTIKRMITHSSIDNEFRYFGYRSKREIEYLTNAKYVFGRTFWDKNITKLFNPNRQYFIINEILRKEFYNNQWDKQEFGETFRIVSTMSPGQPYKGYETLIAAAEYLQKYAKCKFEWHVIGYYPDTRWVKLSEKILNMRSAKNNIIFHGQLDSADMLDILLKSDLYCHVSHIENSPNSVCEAMLLGLPIIASFAGGTSSLLDDRKEGVLVQDGDPYVLAGTILEMKDNFDLAKDMARKARVRAIERHKPENVCNELLTAYKSILKMEGK